ncbi:hypothetical protein F5050DRAFT_1159618 [Lentinula boryana]|uniref:Secreted protein n=1 Tax=Lentinula boryana TaxID=40481 RepID=A0ABQ8QJX4_9AGAR|nr:hypothetical protein F5050DRAFT_1159618 [Lentinula boryana]
MFPGIFQQIVISTICSLLTLLVSLLFCTAALTDSNDRGHNERYPNRTARNQSSLTPHPRGCLPTTTTLNRNALLFLLLRSGR